MKSELIGLRLDFFDFRMNAISEINHLLCTMHQKHQLSLILVK